jgi:acyl-CoA dehydrogenase
MMAHNLATEVFRPISRKYDLAEHEYPKELDMIAAMLDGMNEGDGDGVAGATQSSKKQKKSREGIQNGSNMASVVGIQELCWGDAGLLLSLPRQGLGNAAIAAVASAEQMKRFRGKWAAMAITEPGTGSDSANIRTTAIRDGDHYVLNGEKIFITAGSRADIIVVWATLDPKLGRAAIKSFAVEKGTPGMNLVRLEKKLGIKASDTATVIFENCRVHKDNLLGDPEINVQKGFAGVMETFDNTRPLVAGMAVGLARASLDRTQELLADQIKQPWRAPVNCLSAVEAEVGRMEADWEAARLLTLKAAWMADNGQPNSKEASMAKAKAGRACNAITLKCVELCAGLGYAQTELLEKWSRDSKILDIFEGTQQIQQLIVARRLLGKSSTELK